MSLPAGTITFLFTDIEGSTALLRELGAERYVRALERHRAILRDAFRRHGGVEVDTQGDSFFVAFPTAPGAVAAATEAQAELARGPISVRMGIHTGTPHVTGPNYAGVDVHRAARIAAAAHGGQIIVSAATAALLGDASLRDLGKHRFKDLLEPERIYQVGEREFPPLRAPRETNLPVPATPFVGRETELEEVVELLRRDDIRLLTLVGSGGTGKTRLALQAAAEVADDFSGGVWWVPLAPLRDPQLLLPTVAAALGITDGASDGIAAAVTGALARSRTLLLLDNAEHLLPDLTAGLEVLDAPTRPTLLVTSRERLQTAGERVYSVSAMAARDAAALFVARTEQQGVRVTPTAEVDELCAALDRLPLAIELAAARAALFTPSQLLERVSERLDLLRAGRDADPRQRTLRATMEWSFELLDDNERRVFERLSVFAGGCTYDAAESVCEAGPDTLQSLIDKSLLRRRDTDAEPRYWMLETIREYAALRLRARGGESEARQRHANYYLGLAERAGHELAEGDASRWRWLERLDGDLANLRAMLDWLAAHGAHGELARAGAALWRYWVSRDVSEGLPWLERAATLPVAPRTRVRLLHGLAVIATRLGKLQLAQRAALERVQLHRQLGDERGVADSFILVGAIAGDLGDLAQARSAFEAAVEFARSVDDRTILAGGLSSLGYLALQEGISDEAATRSSEAAALWKELHRDDQVVVAEINLSSARLAQGELHDARAALHRAIRLAVELGDQDHIAYCLDGVAAIDAAEGQSRRAAMLVGGAEAIRAGTGTIREPYEREVSARTEATLRDALGDDYQAVVAEGRAAGADLAVAIALEEEAPIDAERQS